jgi:cytochrome b561
MAGQSWLADTFAGIMIITAAYCASRLVVARRQHRPTDFRVDGVHVLMGVAMAGMLVPRLRVFWAGGWEVIFGVATAWFAWLTIRDWMTNREPRSQGAVSHPRNHHLQHVLGCGAMLYMFLAVGTVAKAAAGGSGMSGMAAGTTHFPTLALFLALALFGYVVAAADRLPSLAPVSSRVARAAPGPVPAGAGGGTGTVTGGGMLAAAADTAAGGSPQAEGRAASAPESSAAGSRAPMSPRLAACCEIAMGVTMGYMLILML